LTLIPLISIPDTNTWVNPARSTSQAIFAGGWAIDQLWMFWLAPIVGALLAGFVYKFLSPEEEDFFYFTLQRKDATFCSVISLHLCVVA